MSASCCADRAGSSGSMRISSSIWSTSLRDWILGKYGKDSNGLWAVDHLSVMLPSSDTRYGLTGGMKLDLGKAQLTAAFTWDCKCLQGEPLTIDERIVPIPAGWSAGGGLKVEF